MLALFVGLIAVVVRILWPKMRRRTGRLGGKGAPGSARKAILNFLAAAQSEELQPLIQFFMQALSPAFVDKSTNRSNEDAANDE